MNTTQLYHLCTNNIDTVQALNSTKSYYQSDSPNLIFFINAHCFNISVKNLEYAHALKKADIVLNDGIGLKIAAKFKGITFKENMNGTDFIPKLIEQAVMLEKRIFLLGGKNGIADRAKQQLETDYPGIKIVGANNGFFDIDAECKLIEKIFMSQADLLIVGFGVPKQELWLTEKISKLNNVKIAVAGGAILDFISGNVKRAPVWVQKIGMEWLFRFIQEPKRLFNRYFIGNLRFFINLLKKW